MCVRVGFGLPALSSPAAGLFIPDTGHDFSPKRARRESLAYSAGARVGRLEVAIAPHSILLICIVAPRFFSVFTRNYIRRGSHFSCVQRFAEIVGCRKLRTGVSVHFAFGARARTPPDGQQGCDQGDGNSAC